ncbi:AraC family transcriptional regulator [Candidatus Viadribacter manganicus]|uniref:AraC family transcriptional regulator n=1 Tax=Candidatus Viadribacter manganicus TaxID=1759059 RepID=UPI001D177C42|nr:helix-turn-helix domain-containing protein [Candidatus Viadribacter manganicus]
MIWELVLRGFALGALAAVAAGLWRSGILAIQIAGALLTAGAAAYVLNSSGLTRDALGFASIPVHLLALGGAGWFWLFIVTLFEDRPISPTTLTAGGILTAVGLVGWLGRQEMSSPIWIGHNLIEAAFAIHGLFVIANSWRGDLVEARRRLRGPVLGVVTIYVIALSGFEIGEGLGLAQSWFPFAGAAALAFMCGLGAIAFLRAEPELFGGARSAQTPKDGLDAGDRLILTKLEALMAEGEAWKREGLTIGALAAETGAPEHKLRRLINDHLGFRNFAAFVNARRIDAAKARLADPAKARESISTIAFDLGFGSLGPFNRAFKEATGQTPTEWRRQRLAETENP